MHKTDSEKLKGFLLVLRRALLMVVREIERMYPQDFTPKDVEG